MPLDEQAALALAGPDVTSLAAAADVETVTAEHVQAAEQAAGETDHKASQSEHAALAGHLSPAQAAADREAARFASRRAAVTRRRAERHQQAERLRQLDAVGQDAVRHAGELKALRERVLERQAKIAELHTANQADITGWTAGLAGIAARGHELQPEPVPPSGRPHASSAHV